MSVLVQKGKQQQTMTLICEEQSSAWLDGRQKTLLDVVACRGTSASVLYEETQFEKN